MTVMTFYSQSDTMSKTASVQQLAATGQVLAFSLERAVTWGKVVATTLYNGRQHPFLQLNTLATDQIIIFSQAQNAAAQHDSLFSGRTGVPRDLPVTEQHPLFTVTVSVISAVGRLHSRSLGVSRTNYRPVLANSCSVVGFDS